MDNNYKEKLKMKIAMFNATEDIEKKSNKYLFKNDKEKGVSLMKKKIIATACASLILVSGIAFATTFKKTNNSDRGLGNGIDTAIENGYISNTNVEITDNNAVGTNTESIIENIKTKIKIENFFMDDVNLSTQILFEFNDSIKNIVNLDRASIELPDLIVRDDENRIIYGGYDQVRFKEYCERNNLNYTFCDFNDNYMPCGVNSFEVMRDAKSNSMRIMYNMYTSGTYPKSKKLYFSFKTIKFVGFAIDNEKKTQVTRKLGNCCKCAREYV